MIALGSEMLQAGIDDLETRLAAVTAERDRARLSIDFWKEQAGTWQQLAYDERTKIDQARQMLADAPHEEGCMLGFHYEDSSVGVCDCWKAGL